MLYDDSIAQVQDKGGVEKHRLGCQQEAGAHCRQGGGGALASEAVQGAALALECVDDVKGGDGLAACMLCVGD